MNNYYLFDVLPLWVSFICIIVLALISAWSGVTFVRWRKKRSIIDEDGPLNTIVGASLALLAFILAFTFGLTTTRFDAKRLYLLEEVNAIETTWLRAGLISEPERTEVKDLLKEYVRIRVVAAKQPEKTLEIVSQSTIIQRQIWSIVTEWIDESPRNDHINALFVEAVNNMFDCQAKRVTVALTYRIPALIWGALIILFMFSMFAVGYIVGKMEKTNWYMILALSITFSAVVLIIVDLDSTFGTIQIDHKPTFDLYQRLSDG
jgi:hypothetical protein